jgi:hypothetical protein
MKWNFEYLCTIFFLNNQANQNQRASARVYMYEFLFSPLFFLVEYWSGIILFRYDWALPDWQQARLPTVD